MLTLVLEPHLSGASAAREGPSPWGPAVLGPGCVRGSLSPAVLTFSAAPGTGHIDRSRELQRGVLDGVLMRLGLNC